jgi:predicted sulfurtransferase
MFTNIAVYKFAPLSDLETLREKLQGICRDCELKGTILLSPEGINLFVAGTQSSIQTLLTELRSITGFEDLNPKESFSENQPFRRMLVRLKKEIIAFGVEGIEPGKKSSAKISAQTLRQWIDEGKPLTLLDTRNDYEIRMGTFEGAIPAGVEHFRDFPNAVEKLSPELKERTIVMFCTGGIRCEKAGPFMERAGFQNVFQLDGGILKYFEECGGAHYKGDCFVFDRRVCVDSQLCETSAAICFSCQMPLTEQEQRHPHYLVGETCPFCHPSREPSNESTAGF